MVNRVGGENISKTPCKLATQKDSAKASSLAFPLLAHLKVRLILAHIYRDLNNREAIVNVY